MYKVHNTNYSKAFLTAPNRLSLTSICKFLLKVLFTLWLNITLWPLYQLLRNDFLNPTHNTNDSVAAITSKNSTKSGPKYNNGVWLQLNACN